MGSSVDFLPPDPEFEFEQSKVSGLQWHGEWWIVRRNRWQTLVPNEELLSLGVV